MKMSYVLHRTSEPCYSLFLSISKGISHRKAQWAMLPVQSHLWLASICGIPWPPMSFPFLTILFHFASWSSSIFFPNVFHQASIRYFKGIGDGINVNVCPSSFDLGNVFTLFLLSLRNDLAKTGLKARRKLHTAKMFVRCVILSSLFSLVLSCRPFQSFPASGTENSVSVSASHFQLVDSIYTPSN